MTRTILIGAFWFLGLLGLSTAPALADDGFALVEMKDGVVRVDRESGAVSYCRRINATLACSVAADERVAWEEENERLLERIVELEERVAKLEGVTGDVQREEETVLTPQEEQKMDKAMRVAETFMRRFITMMKDISRDLQSN